MSTPWCERHYSGGHTVTLHRLDDAAWDATLRRHGAVVKLQSPARLPRSSSDDAKRLVDEVLQTALGMKPTGEWTDYGVNDDGSS